MNDISAAALASVSALTLSGRLAVHAAATRCEAIPAAALDAAKLFMLDTLAVSWAGSDAPGCREAHTLLIDEGGRADSTAWAYGGLLPATAAAFINGMTASALDYDSIGRGAAVHINIAVLPAALALAPKKKATGPGFLGAPGAGPAPLYRPGGGRRRRGAGAHRTPRPCCPRGPLRRPAAHALRGSRARPSRPTTRRACRA